MKKKKEKEMGNAKKIYTGHEESVHKRNLNDHKPKERFWTSLI